MSVRALSSLAKWDPTMRLSARERHDFESTLQKIIDAYSAGIEDEPSRSSLLEMARGLLDEVRRQSNQEDAGPFVEQLARYFLTHLAMFSSHS
jgi:hypothetical protein